MPSTETEWEEYRDRELRTLEPLLRERGYELSAEQPHVMGERFLMQAMTTTSGKKLILLGERSSDHMRVVIKATRDSAGKRELAHEHLCRSILTKLRFAYQAFVTPNELDYLTTGGYLITVQKYIEQEKPFLARPLPEQFSYALGAFKAQESVHAATYEHARLIKKTFGSIDASAYLQMFAEFVKEISTVPFEKAEAGALLQEAQAFLGENIKTIEQYSGFLTHTDFVPHNFRIADGTLYLLDYSSLRFGNKYEGWARFLNFMALYNPELERLLIQYVKDNRTPEESLSLKLMRLYRLGEIISYYTKTLSRSTGNLLLLNQARREFWLSVLQSVLADTPLDAGIREQYKDTRDSLRSEDEKFRQKDLH